MITWQSLLNSVGWIYAILNVALAGFSLHMLILLILSIKHRNDRIPETTCRDEDLPTVLVQLPVYNERYVVERLIDAAVAIDYPVDKIIIQVLDDSTDVTTTLAQKRVAFHVNAGRNVQFIHRTDRKGYKAGALSQGLQAAPGEFMAIFDADFIPPKNFLRAIIPMFLQDHKLGVVQSRWEHLNLDQNAITHVIGQALDIHFAIDQIARSRSGLLMNFNGSCCVLRRACVEDAGGWQDDTLVEDLDLSYRVQMKGWRITYRPDVTVPGELPASIISFKQQQFRWAKGTVQALRKLGWRLLTSNRTLPQKLEGLFHLTSYFTSPLMIITYLLSLPVVYLFGHLPFNSALLGVAVLIPPIAAAWSQARLRTNWWRSVLFYPVLFLTGIGVSLTITQAIWEAIIGHKSEFVRTPKFSNAHPQSSVYALSVDRATWVELLMAAYGIGTSILAVERAPTLAPFIMIYAFAFLLTAGMSLANVSRSVQTRRLNQDA
ncbi:MAG TPA: glycosyltransferase [Anaerolineaceae bacterium]|nr:glycosyltransferase [Anaerolineaceae bacterium]HPN53198.1 glycosyltransferase [Anaerolineaceae bacterium]